MNINLEVNKFFRYKNHLCIRMHVDLNSSRGGREEGGCGEGG